MKRKSYKVTKVGSLNNLKLVEEEILSPSEDEVTVEVKAIGLNFADVFTILGMYKASPKRDFIPGLEFSGVITDKGTNVTYFSKGDRIMGVTRFGAYTTHINIDHRYIIKLLEDWSFEDGASFIVQALTAYYALIPLGNINKLQERISQPTVLIHSAAGGVGIYANRIAKKFSAYTIGTIITSGLNLKNI
jgi:NADPH:quinone reductase-like Zn-dependent oxidoreductase